MPTRNDLYKEIGEAWRNYVSWQEKLFAGYLTVLAALGYGFLNANTRIRLAILAFAALVSVVFRIIDWRTAELVNRCQSCGELIGEDRSIYAGINHLRSNSGLSRYGLAIDLLTAALIVAGSVGSVWLYYRNHFWRYAFISTSTVALLIFVFRKIDGHNREREASYLSDEKTKDASTSNQTR